MLSSSFFFSRRPGAAAFVLAAALFPSSLFSGTAGGKAKAPVEGPYDPWVGESRFYFSAGWMWRETGGADFRSGSRSQTLSLPRLFRAARTEVPLIGAPGEYGERQYLDGFVRTDAGTVFDGTTSAWSYADASQVRDGALHYHASGSRRESSGGRSSHDADDAGFDGAGGAPVIEIGWETELTPRWSAGAKFQWSFLDFDGTHTHSNFSAWQRGGEFSQAYTDTYDLRGIVPPAAPYEGAGLGFGPLIDNLPTSRHGGETATSSSTARFFNRISQSFEVKLHTLSLGPTVSWRTGPVSVQGGAGFALNLVDWEAEQEETLYVRRDNGPARVFQRWQDQRHDTEVLPGCYLQGAVSWHITPRVFVSGFGRYDWSEKLEERVGPSTFTFDPGGWSAGVLLGFSF